MKNLEQLYKEREVLLKYNASTEEVEAKINAILNTKLAESAETVIGYLPDEVEAPENSSFVIAAQYVSGKLVKTATAFNIDLVDKFEVVNDIQDPVDMDEEDLDEDTPTRQRSRRSKSIGFTVKFGDGKEVKRQLAVLTMIDALRYMGLERASLFSDISFKDYPFIGRKKRPGDRWQKNVDGWWIYVNMTNSRKVECLEGVAKMLNIPMEIIWDDALAPSFDFGDENNIPQPKAKIIRAKYSLNGATPLPKNRTVWLTVKRLLEELPSASFDTIADLFPAALQGSYGVVRTVEDIETRSQRNKTENIRWFLDPSELLTANDGTTFAVSNEWGENFVNFIDHVQKEFGWTIEETK